MKGVTVVWGRNILLQAVRQSGADRKKRERVGG